jgi:hypothetical protein
MNISLGQEGRLGRCGELSQSAPVCRTGDGAPAYAAQRCRSANLSAMSTIRRRSGRVRAARVPSRALGLVLAVPALLMLYAVPALAAPEPQPDVGRGDIGDPHSPASQSLLTMILLYVGIPALGFLVAYLLSLRSGRKSDRYRPGQPWQHGAAWFGSSEQEADSVQEQRRRAALPGAGGASGRW